MRNIAEIEAELLVAANAFDAAKLEHRRRIAKLNDELALARAAEKLARMSDGERAALARVIGAEGIPSAEAHGVPGRE